MDIWAVAGSAALMVNFVLPVVAGIMTADRLPRDRRLGMWEILGATPTSRGAYLAGKYAGSLLATLTPPIRR